MFSDAFSEGRFRFRVTADGSDRIGLGIMHKNNPRDQLNGPESFPFFSICLIRRGSGSYEDCATGKVYPLGPGMFFMRQPGIEHIIRIDIESGWLECFLDLGNFSWSYAKHYFAIAEDVPVGRFEPDGEWDREFLDLLKRVPDFPVDRLFLLVRELFHLAAPCMQGIRQRTREEAMVHNACVYLCSDFSLNYDIKEFCRENGWGYDNFRKIFSAVMGISPHQYRIRRRMDAARALLIQKELSVKEIAGMLGYCSPGEFTAKFKTFFGVPPQLFRKNLPLEAFTGLGSISGRKKIPESEREQ